eukprot:TRINITY_DN7586_c3_g1_i1.p1 TRINITY_DN7586_c3_g1~~TRINITY_DN7586_c3_g1_i1.p1  ORF type:complete len:123 (-),score=2.48 TRINITY_DN7586_c3_g1_i1:116-484(-)
MQLKRGSKQPLKRRKTEKENTALKLAHQSGHGIKLKQSKMGKYRNKTGVLIGARGRDGDKKIGTKFKTGRTLKKKKKESAPLETKRKTNISSKQVCPNAIRLTKNFRFYAVPLFFFCPTGYC